MLLVLQSFCCPQAQRKRSDIFIHLRVASPSSLSKVLSLAAFALTQFGHLNQGPITRFTLNINLCHATTVTHFPTKWLSLCQCYWATRKASHTTYTQVPLRTLGVPPKVKPPLLKKKTNSTCLRRLNLICDSSWLEEREQATCTQQ